MERSPVCHFPYILPSQAQKHVTHNEAVRMLDSLLHLRVQAIDAVVPPLGVVDGAAVIVAVGAEGIFAGKDGHVAAFQDGGWLFFPPRPGLVAYDEAEGRFVYCDGEAWLPLLAGPFPLLGINATADAVNRLAVGSDASLFSHAGTGHRVVVNKAAAGEAASILFQTNFDGRAEFGIVGDDDLRLKVSPDGANFKEALAVDRTNGRVRFAQGVEGARPRLAADRIYYVSPTGSDAHDGLAADTPFVTIQQAIDAALDLDCAGYAVTVQLAAGIYDGQAALNRPLTGADRLTILGDVNAPETVVMRHNANVVMVSQGAWLVLRGVALETTSWGSGLHATGGGTIHFGEIEFRSVARMHMEIAGSGKIAVVGNYAIAGGAIRHIYANGSGAFIEATNRTVDLVGTPAFSAFAAITANASMSLWGTAFSGPATGKRYEVSMNASLASGGPNATAFPGNAAGTTATGGQYQGP